MTKVTGELVSIDDSAYDGFQGMTIYGKTVQNLWVNPSGTNSGVTVTSNADGSITVSGTNTDAITIYSSSIYTLKPNTRYVAFVDKPISGSTSSSISFAVVGVQIGGGVNSNAHFGYEGRQSLLFTTGNALSTNCRCVFCANTSVSAGIKFSGTYRVMLREVTAEEISQGKVLDTTWCPPGLSSIDNVEVVTAGKNLAGGVQDRVGNHGCNWEVLENGLVHVSGTPTFASVNTSIGPNTSATMNASLSIGKTMTVKSGLVSGGIPSGARYQFIVRSFDASGIEISNCISTNGSASFFKVSSNTKTLGWYFVVSNITIGSTFDAVLTGQLELGSTATDYEPPNITTTPIDLQGHTLNSLPDGTRDELHIDGGGNVVLEKRVGAATAPTAAGSWFWGTAGAGIASFTLSAKSTGTQTDMTEIMRCDKLPVQQKSGEVSYAIVGRTQGHAKNHAITSTATAATVVGGATYLYKLADPQTIQLGKISLPKLRKKPLVNNVWTNGTAEGTGFSLAPEIDYEYNQWSTYCDGFRTHGKHSYFDMGCCIAARDTGTPEKKSVTATVPYMSGFYDLSKLYGAIAFEARQLMYRFEFVEDSRDELQQRKSQFLEWLSQVHDEEIADDDIPGRHFIGSLSEWEFEEGEEGQSGSLEVTFNCQPFLEADEDTTKTCKAGSNTVTVNGQAVNAYAKTSSGTATIRIGGVAQSVGTTEIRLSVQLQPGDNAVTVTGSPVTLRWKELTV